MSNGRRRRSPVIVIGAGMGGLAAALRLASRDQPVLVLERACRPGGKLRSIAVGGREIDSGPTVFTMRWVFDDLFSCAGLALSDCLALEKAEVLARHAWDDRGHLDLFADVAHSADAIGSMMGAGDAKAFLSFCAEARRVYETLHGPFLTSQPSGPVGLVAKAGLLGLPGLLRINPFATLMDALERRFSDPRLRQLFGRYATYCGSSPYLSPATLMLVAHVEQDGVWLVEGGMERIADAFVKAASAAGAEFRFDTLVRDLICGSGRATGVRTANGDEIEASAVIFNGDVNALATGKLGDGAREACTPVATEDRSLSAVTASIVAHSAGFPLSRHNVFFGPRYESEFAEIFKARHIPREPTVYLCAQDRSCSSSGAGQPEAMLCLVNAPPDGDRRDFTSDAARAVSAMMQRFSACGLSLDVSEMMITTPNDFAALYPATGGALYGRNAHGWKASFARPGARSRIPGLYLAGGSTHPGPGLPMAALSGQMAAESVLEDRALT